MHPIYIEPSTIEYQAAEKAVAEQSRCWSSRPSIYANFERQVHADTDDILHRSKEPWRVYEPTWTRQNDRKAIPQNAAIGSYIDTILKHLRIPPSWVAEGISLPSQSCLTAARIALRDFYDRFELLPVRISATAERTIVACYRNEFNQNTLDLEIDDEADVAAVVSNGHDILGSAFSDDSTLREIIEGLFLARTAQL